MLRKVMRGEDLALEDRPERFAKEAPVLEHHEVRDDDRDAFLEAITNPAPPTSRLVAALRKHRKLGAAR